MDRVATLLALSLALALIGAGCQEYDLGPGGGGHDPAGDDDDAVGDDDDDDGTGSHDEPDPDGFDPEDGDDDDDDTSPGVPIGNVLTILLTMNDMYMDQSVSRQLQLNSVGWVTPASVPDPRVLIIRDDEHSDEHPEDSEQMLANLLSVGYDATLVEEPEDGIDISALAGYSVVLLSNPGHSPDDLSTLEAMYAFSCAGYGLIFQGDDMSHFDDPDDFDMESLTRLRFIDNGQEYHGHDIDNDEDDRYEVTIEDMAHPVVAGIENITLLYGDDIDTTEPAHVNETVLAWATVEGTNLPLKPAIAGYSQ